MKKLHIAALLAATAMAASVAVAQTSFVSGLMAYQGHVSDSSGNDIGTGTPVSRAVIFKLYTTATGGTPIWAETQTATIAAGEFSVLIGNGTGVSNLPGPSAPAQTPYKPLADVVNAQSSSAVLYLGVTVDDGNPSSNDPEISPRQQIVSGVFAMRAKVAESLAANAVTTAGITDSAISTAKIAAGAITTAKLASDAVATATVVNSAITAAKLADSSVTSSKIDQSTVGLWSVSGSNVYRSAGNVGIGRGDAPFPLSFFSALGPKIGLFGDSVSGNQLGFGVQQSVLQIYCGNSTDRVGIGHGKSDAFSEFLSVKNGGVGINNTNPTFPLHFQSITGAKICLYGGGTDYYGFGIQAGELLLKTANGQTIGFGQGSDTDQNDRMLKINASTATFRTDITAYGKNVSSQNVLTVGCQVSAILAVGGYGFDGTGSIITDGRVGIGTKNPVVPLDVRSTVFQTYAEAAYFLNYNSGFATTGGSGQRNVSIRAEGVVLSATGFSTSSDFRIKKNIQTSDSSADLSTLLSIPVRDYQYVDPVLHGVASSKKVIAQEVEKVLPVAVTQSEGVVPDIMKKALQKGGWIALTTDLKVGDRVRVITKTQDAVFDVLEASAGKFRTALATEEKECFVYGREVKDLRSVDYDAIAMLNVSATQEIARLQNAARATVTALSGKVASLEAACAAKDKANAALEARLAALEKRMGASK